MIGTDMVGYSVNSDADGVALQTKDSCGWFPWDRVESIPRALAVNEW